MIVNRKALNFWERLYLPAIIGGFKVTLRHFFKKKMTMQYPEEVGARGQRSRGAGSLTPETIMAIHSPIGLSELQKMKSGRVRLFIKPHCGWCHQAKEYHG